MQQQPRKRQDKFRRHQTAKWWGLAVFSVIVACLISLGLWWQNMRITTPQLDNNEAFNESYSRVETKHMMTVSEREISRTDDESASSYASNASNNELMDLFTRQFGQLKGLHAFYFMPVNQEDKIVAFQATQSMRSASVIKLFILSTVYQEATQGKLDLDETYTLQQSDIVGGTGQLQAEGAGFTTTLRDLAKLMITVSDNTATNILIKRLGGVERVNQLIGQPQVKLQRLMMDFDAVEAGRDNYVSAEAVGIWLQKVAQYQLVSSTADAEMLNFLEGQTNRTTLEANLPDNVTIYNKTGENDQYGVQHDAQIVSTSKGQYVLVVLSQEGSEEVQVAAMRQFGRAVFDYFMAENPN